MSGRSGWSVRESYGEGDRQPAARVRTSEGKVRRGPASFLAGVPLFEDGDYLAPSRASQPGHRVFRITTVLEFAAATFSIRWS